MELEIKESDNQDRIPARFWFAMEKIHPFLRKKEMANIASQLLPQEREELNKRVEEISNNNDREDLEELLKYSPSPVLIFKYLLAPVEPQQGLDTKEDILSNFKNNKIDTNNPQLTTKFNIGFTTISALSCIALGASAGIADLLIPLQIVDDFASASYTTIGGVAGLNSLTLISKPKQILPVLKTIKDLVLLTTQRSYFLEKYQKEVPLINSFTKEDTWCELDKLFGYKNNKEELFKNYKQIQKPDRHLISHLEGVELRAFLLGDDKQRQSILMHNPPSFEARLSCALSRYPDQEDILKNARKFYNQYLDPVIHDWQADVQSIDSITLSSSILRMRNKKLNTLNSDVDMNKNSPKSIV